MPTAEILSQGDEILTGQITDTNAGWLSEQLTAMGFSVRRQTSIGDSLNDIATCFRRIPARADICICTGGLGPTEDDLTIEAAAIAHERAMVFDPQAFEHLQALFMRNKRSMSPSNRKQAWAPKDSIHLNNTCGTAPGFALDFNDEQHLLFCLPGVPHEMKTMFEQQVKPLLHERFDFAPTRLVTLRTTGIGESQLQDRIGPWHETDMVLSYRTTPTENHIKVRFPAQTPDTEMATVIDELAARIGSPVFAIDGLESRVGGSLVEVIGRELIAQGSTLAIAESCTGGLIASMCTAISGASTWFTESVTTYSNEAKTRYLDVPSELIEQYGAVSQQVAVAMAQGLLARSGATYALTTTGVAGPGGGSPEKPIGTVHISLATKTTTYHRQFHFPGERILIQTRSAVAALDLLRRLLQQHLTS